MASSADPDRRSQLIWIYTVCKGRTYLGSAGLGFKIIIVLKCGLDSLLCTELLPIALRVH